MRETARAYNPSDRVTTFLSINQRYLAKVWASIELFVINEAIFIWQDMLDMILTCVLDRTKASMKKRKTLPKIWSKSQTSVIAIVNGALDFQRPVPLTLHPNRKLLIVKMVWAALKSLKLALSQPGDRRCVFYCGGIVLRTIMNTITIYFGSINNFLIECCARSRWE